jgi:hypothetical protein
MQVDTLEFPLRETKEVIGTMAKAEAGGDLKTLQWCARKLKWLYGFAEMSSTEISPREADLFQDAWIARLVLDLPPESVKGIL